MWTASRDWVHLTASTPSLPPPSPPQKKKNYKGEESKGFWQISFSLGWNVEEESALSCLQLTTCYMLANV